MEFDVRDYRETRSVGMVRFADREGRGDRFAQDVSARLARLGVYEPERRRWLPHVTVLRFRAPPRLHPEPPALGRVQSVRCRALPFPPAAERGAVFRDRSSSIRRLRQGGSRASTRRRPEPDRAAVRQGLRDEDERPGTRVDRRRVDRLALARPRARRGRPAARPHRRDLRPGVLGQDDARLPRHRRGAAAGRHLRLHRRRARDGPAATRARSASTPTTCSSRSRTTASRRSRSPSCSSAPARSTSSPSTRSPR